MTATTRPACRVEEPALPRRVRRPVDAVRLLGGLLGVAFLLAVAAAASATTTGLDADLAVIGARVPDPVVAAVALAAALAGMALLPGVVVARLVQRRLWAAGMVAVAVPLAVVTTALVAVWLRGPAPAGLAADFTPADSDSPGLSGFVAGLVAAATTASLSRRVRNTFVLVVSAAVVSGLLAGASTVLSALLSLALGRLAGLGVRLVVGSAAVRPDGAVVARLLAEHGLAPVSVRAADDNHLRGYRATTERGLHLDVTVLERDRLGAELLPRLWRLVRTRGQVLPRGEVTLEGAAERRTALALAAAAAGVRTPRVLLAVAAEPDAALVVHEHHDTRPLGEHQPGEVPDRALADTWRQIRRLHLAGIAHRSVSPRSVRLDDAGRCWLYDTSTGQVAATSFARQLDVAQGLAALAAVVGPQRAVGSATEALGSDAVGRALPLLQPIALPAATRGALHGRGPLLSELRTLAAAHGAAGAAAAPAPLERFRPRTLFTAVGLVVALYLVGSELVGVDVGAVVGQANWWWVAAAVVGVVSTYVGSAASLTGFVRDRVPFTRAVGAQLALSFVKLVTPSAVGNAAINVRMLSRAGVPEASAAASVAAGQVAAVLVTVPLLLLLGLLTGQAVASGLAPSPTALGVLGVVVGGAALLLLIRPVRERLARLWRNFLDQGLPPLIETLQTPRKLAVGLGGNLLLTAGYTLALYACVEAVGGEVSIPLAAVVFLTGNTVGTAVPTPGGLGAIEAALVTGLGAAGVPGGLAVPAVLLFRLLSFWLPLIPGYLAWTGMQRRGLL